MEVRCLRYCRSAVILVLAALGIGAPAQALGDAGVAVFPGMEIHQGNTVCTLGWVDPRLRVAMTTGRCDGGPTVTDKDSNVLGTVTVARHDTTHGTEVDASTPDVEYELIKLAPEVTATDVLPTGRQLQSSPGLRAQSAEPLCHFGISTGESCGQVSSAINGWFTVADMANGEGDVGGPVYAVGDDNRAVILGFFEGSGGTSPQVESWQAVMHQLAVDIGPSDDAGVRVVSQLTRHL